MKLSVLKRLLKYAKPHAAFLMLALVDPGGTCH